MMKSQLLYKSQVKHLSTFHTNDVTLFPSRVVYYSMVPMEQQQIQQVTNSQVKNSHFALVGGLNNQMFNPQ